MNEYAVTADSFEELAPLIEAHVARHPELTNWWGEPRNGRWVAEPVADPPMFAGARFTPVPRRLSDSELERARIHRAYVAMRRLEEHAYPARVRSRVGMERLLRAVFNVPEEKPLVHWAWPAQAIARARNARVWS